VFARMKSGAGKRVFACVYLRALLVKGAGDLADYDRHDHKKTGMNKEKEKFPAGPGEATENQFTFASGGWGYPPDPH